MYDKKDINLLLKCLLDDIQDVDGWSVRNGDIIDNEIYEITRLIGKMAVKTHYVEPYASSKDAEGL